MASTRSVAALLGLAAGTFLFSTAEALPVGLLIPMAAELQVPATHIGSLVTIYATVVMLASVPLTALVRRVPRRLVLAGVLVGFTASNGVAAVAESFELLVVTRFVSGAMHALFWSVVVQAAAELFRPEIRGRVVSVVFAGGNIALAVGVPAGTWLGDQLGWRAAFVGVAVLGVLVTLVVGALVPTTRPEEGHAARGSEPSVRRYVTLVTVAVLTTAGSIAAYTYIALFVTEVSGLAASDLGAVLFVRGVASVVGILAFGRIVDRNPWRALVVATTLQLVAIGALLVLGENPIAATVLFALTGFAFAGFTASLGALVLQVAPGRSDIAAAALSASVNVGIAAGAFAAGLALPVYGVVSSAVIGAALSVLALAAVAIERLAPRREGEPARSSA